MAVINGAASMIRTVGRTSMSDICPDCENGEYRTPQERGVLYWVLLFCTAGLFAAINSLIHKRRLVCPTCGRFYQ